MCCLKYEQEHYEQTRKIMPRIGREVKTPDGTGTVSDLNIVKETVFVRIATGDTSEIKEYPLEAIEKTGQVSSKPENFSSGKEESKVSNPEDNSGTGSGKDDNHGNQNADEHTGDETRKTGKEKGAMESGSRRNERSQGKERIQQRQERQNRLGKPVLRENPNRVKSEHNAEKNGQKDETERKNAQPETIRNDHTERKPEEKPAEKAAKNSFSWSEAVRKAMESIQ